MPLKTQLQSLRKLLRHSCTAAPAYLLIAALTTEAKQVRVWVPDEVSVLRGAVLYQAMDFKDWTSFYGEPWRAVARAWGFALVTANYGVVHDSAFFWSELKRLGDSLGHSELPNLPFCAFGNSASALGALEFMAAWPERTIAVHANVIHWQTKPWEDARYRQVPLLHTLGEKDELVKLRFALPHSFEGRKRGALWSAAIMWGVGHMFDDCFTLARAFFDETIGLRLADDADPREGPVSLRTLREEDGWLGDTTSWALQPQCRTAPFSQFSSDSAVRARAVWLPGPATAGVWSAFMSRKRNNSLLPHSNPGTVVPVGLPVRLQANFTSPQPERLRFYAGDSLLGESDSSAFHWTPKAPGVYTLYAHAKVSSSYGFTSLPTQFIAQLPPPSSLGRGLGHNNMSTPPGTSRGSSRLPHQEALRGTPLFFADELPGTKAGTFRFRANGRAVLE